MANIELDGANKKIKVDSGDLTLDIPGDIILDADGGDITFADGGTNILKVTNSSSDVVFQAQVDAKDIKFNQYDGRTLLDINDGGYVGIANGATGPGQLRLYEDTDNGTNYTAFQVGTQSGDVTYTLPTADGSNGQVLSTNGSGTLSWGAAGGYSVSDITGATALAVEPAQTDEINISDGGSLKRLDFSHIMPVPMILVTRTNNQTINNTTATKVEWDSPIKQQGGTWSSTDYRFTPGVAGYYQSQILMRWNNFIPDAKQGGPQLYKNGSHFYTYGSMQNFRSDQTTLSGSDVMMTHPIYLDDDDYLEMMVWHNAGSSGSFGGGYNSWLVYRLVGMST